MAGAIADGEDVDYARSAFLVDVDPVLSGGSGPFDRLDGRNNSDADDHHIGGDLGSIGQFHPCNIGTIAKESLHTHAEPQIDALLCMHGLHEITDGFVGHA